MPARCTPRSSWCCARLRHHLDPAAAARDARISIAIAYRYLHEGLDAIATQVPDLHGLLDRAHSSGLALLCLDGALASTDRVAARAEADHNL